MKKKNKPAAKKATTKKPAVRTATAKKPTAKKAAPAAAPRRATYSPPPVQGIGWAPFRYPPQ